VKQRELKPQKPLKVSSVDGLEIGPEHLIEQQRSAETLKSYCKLSANPPVEGKPPVCEEFVRKKGILYRKLKTKNGVKCKLQLVVPVRLTEKVVALLP